MTTEEFKAIQARVGLRNWLKPKEFILESNRIEGIFKCSNAQIAAHHRFMDLECVTVRDLLDFVSVYQPGAKLRDHTGMDVRVGDYRPPRGGPNVAVQLEGILRDANKRRPNLGEHSFEIHREYEELHPFGDCNGRSGRMLWLWMMRAAPLGFLHTWYYQSLAK